MLRWKLLHILLRFNLFVPSYNNVFNFKSVYVHVSYSERFPSQSYFTVQYTVHPTDEQHAMSSHESQSALMLTMEFSNIYYTR
jgi:hypothetical protein